MVTRMLVRRNLYSDSVALMTLSQRLMALPGVEDAAAVMATEMNQKLLRQADLLDDQSARLDTGGPNDLLIVVRAESNEAAETALHEAENSLKAAYRTDTSHHALQPRTLAQTLHQQTPPNLAVISVPGAYAALEAREALLAGLHVLLFSDNVSLEQEIALKKLAVQRNLLVMGPDCGTALLNGVGLGFANAVPRGPIGIVSASGTGLQQVSSLIASYGSGVSQAIGTGGRDLSQAVGGSTMLAGLEMLQQDAQTRVIVLISKPPAPSVAQRVIEAASKGTKPTVVAFLGADLAFLPSSHALHAPLYAATTLAAAARSAMRLAGGQAPEPDVVLSHEAEAAIQAARAALHPEQRFLRGLFSGGTLCDEAMTLMSARLGPLYSNIPLRPAWELENISISREHTAIDFGSDEFTRGRPHPMIDPSLRLRRLEQEARDPTTAVILLDIVLGYGTHLDPAGAFAPAIERARASAAENGRSLICIVSLCGTEQDIQGFASQQEQFRQAGTLVFSENAVAALVAAEIVAIRQAENTTPDRGHQ